MRFSAAYYQTEETIQTHLPCLTDAQQRGLTWWVHGTILAGSACQNAVICALCIAEREGHAVRQYLREWLYDGADKATPCTTQVEVRVCFAPLLRWVLTLWDGDRLALAIDATAHGQAVTALVVSVLYRGSAIPVGWVILAGTPRAPGCRRSCGCCVLRCPTTCRSWCSPIGVSGVPGSSSGSRTWAGTRSCAWWDR